jgi:hypothetical protein
MRPSSVILAFTSKVPERIVDRRLIKLRHEAAPSFARDGVRGHTACFEKLINP